MRFLFFGWISQIKSNLVTWSQIGPGWRAVLRVSKAAARAWECSTDCLDATDLSF